MEVIYYCIISVFESGRVRSGALVWDTYSKSNMAWSWTWYCMGERHSLGIAAQREGCDDHQDRCLGVSITQVTSTTRSSGTVWVGAAWWPRTRYVWETTGRTSNEPSHSFWGQIHIQMILKTNQTLLWSNTQIFNSQYWSLSMELTLELCPSLIFCLSDTWHNNFQIISQRLLTWS